MIMNQTTIHGNVHTGGDFVGRDKIDQQINYHDVRPASIDPAHLDAALVKLATMPLDTIPASAAPPVGSRMPLSYNPLFVGRGDEFKRLAAHLKGGTTVAVGQIAAATGIGGIGKTQLAATFVHHYGQFFAGGVYWLNFDNGANVPTEIAQCGAVMNDLRLDYAHLPLADQVCLVLAA